MADAYTIWFEAIMGGFTLSFVGLDWYLNRINNYSKKADKKSSSQKDLIPKKLEILTLREFESLSL